jgi:hypothetical protein
MPELNVDLYYHEHPQTKRLVAVLGKCADIYPIRIWSYTGRLHPQTGKLEGYTDGEVEALAGWEGEPGALIAAMTHERSLFLERIHSGFIVHNFMDRQGHLAAYSKRSKAANKARWKNTDDEAEGILNSETRNPKSQNKESSNGTNGTNGTNSPPGCGGEKMKKALQTAVQNGAKNPVAYAEAVVARGAMADAARPAGGNGGDPAIRAKRLAKIDSDAAAARKKQADADARAVEVESWWTGLEPEQADAIGAKTFAAKLIAWEARNGK